MFLVLKSKKCHFKDKLLKMAQYLLNSQIEGSQRRYGIYLSLKTKNNLDYFSAI